MSRFPFAATLAALAVSACGPGADVPTASSVPPAASVPVAPLLADAVAAAPELTVLAGTIRAGGLATLLTVPGPLTLFAPTDAAFARLAPGTVANLLQPQNSEALAKFIRYHAVAGTLSAADLRTRIAAGGGRAALVTLEGEPLTATLTGTAITLTDVNGNHSYIESADAIARNGVIHRVNGVLVPRID